jgi:cytochrome P450
MDTDASSALPPKFDSRDPAVLADPYPVYRTLRQAGGLCRGGPGQWVVSRYRDVVPLLRTRRLSHEYPEEYHRFSVGEGPAMSFFQRIMLDRDPPAHTALRGAMARAFSPRLVARLNEFIAVQVDALLRPARDTDRFELVDELAFPLPVALVCELVGIPVVDRKLVRPKAIDLAKGFALQVAAEDRGPAHDAVSWLREYISDLMEQRRRNPGEDLLTMLIEVGHDSAKRLSPEEIVDNVVFLFFAGFETTTNLLATTGAALADHPAEYARLRADAGLIPTAVDEFLRWDAPIQATARLVRQDVEVAGRHIRAGRVVVLLLGSANHDEEQFASPDVLDVGRDPNPHVSFGGGLHFCLGAALARQEASAVLSWLVRNAPTIGSAGPAVRLPSVAFRSYRSVPVTIR